MGATLPTNTRNEEEASTHGLVRGISTEADTPGGTVPAPLPLARRTYQYPPLSGNKYFLDNFKLGTKKFSNLNLQDFLFGDSSDLNFLPSESGPIPFKRAPDSLLLSQTRTPENSQILLSPHL